MASITGQTDDDLRGSAYKELEEPGVKPSALGRQAMQYVAEGGRLPLAHGLVAEEDEVLIETVRERLGNPLRVRVLLGEL